MTGALPDQASADAPAARPGRVSQAKVALLLPLTGAGTTAPIAKGLKQAAEMALIEQGGTSLQLIVKDDGGTPEGARAAAAEAIKDGAELILGPLFAKSVEAVAPAARQAGVPIIAFSNDRRVAGTSTYLVSFLAEQEVERIIGYAASRGKRQFAALVPDDAYGKVTEATFRAAVARHGGSVKSVQVFPATANAMLEPVRTIAETIRESDASGQPVDALFIPASVDALSTLGPQLAYAKIDPRKVQLLGTGGWDTPQLGKDAVYVGGWYPAPDPRGWRDFSEKFARTFGSPAPRIATLAYDAVSIAIALAAGPAKVRFTDANLTRAGGFSGVDGPVRLLADGTAERSFAVLEVQKFGSSLIDQAPLAFGAGRLSSIAPRVN